MIHLIDILKKSCKMDKIITILVTLLVLLR